MVKDKIAELRKKIDSIDDELCKLLLERANIANEINLIKKENNIQPISITREMEIFERLTDDLDDVKSDYIRQIYQELFKATHTFTDVTLSLN